jgi:nicotinate-nucleotide adenylyltransferase
MLKKPPSYPCPSITVGLLGGSFNPAHAGHVYISEIAKKQLGLDEIWWLVTPNNPLKPASIYEPLETRMTHACNITKNRPYIKVWDIEKNFSTNYTADTIKNLQQIYRHIKFVWIMGADNMQQFSKWHKWQQITESVPIVIIARGKNKYPAFKSKFPIKNYRQREKKFITHAPCWQFINCKLNPISSTELRNG